MTFEEVILELQKHTQQIFVRTFKNGYVIYLKTKPKKLLTDCSLMKHLLQNTKKNKSINFKTKFSVKE